VREDQLKQDYMKLV